MARGHIRVIVECPRLRNDVAARLGVRDTGRVVPK